MEFERSKETLVNTQAILCPQNDKIPPQNELLESRCKGRAGYSLLPTNDLKILVISKPFDEECNEYFHKVLSFLHKHRIEIYTTKSSLEAVKDDPVIRDHIKPQIYTDDIRINRIITLGGDGTILFSIKMFYNKSVPPMISFGLGSVGYL